MSSEYLRTLQADRRQAVTELTDIITIRYPSASFVIEPGEDDPGATNIIAVVDIDDPDEVMDLVIDRLVELQVEDEVPISVIPIRSPERTAQQVRARREHGRASAALRPTS